MSILRFSFCELSVDDPDDFIPPHSTVSQLLILFLYSYILKLSSIFCQNY